MVWRARNFPCFYVRQRVPIHFPSESKASLMDGANQGLVRAAVADRSSGRADARAERCIRNRAALPERVDKLILAYDARAVTYQIDEEIEYLWLEVEGMATPPQLPLPKVNLKLAEAEIQSFPPLLNQFCSRWRDRSG